ncbi:MAG: xanthine dehydrogenase family protein molybdopterin-binding subunit [Pseudomonadota bacterium]
MFGKIKLPAPPMNRRSFLKVVGLSGAGFMVGCSESTDAVEKTSSGMRSTVSTVDLGPFVRINSDNTVTVIVKHLDKGQGSTTGLPAVVAEELDADWSQMRAEFAPANTEVYKNLFFGVMGTGGSTGMANSWMQLRNAAAGARAMLVGAAAARWGVDAADIHIANGVVSHGESRASFGELAADAAAIAPPAEPVLKDPSEFTLIGTHLPRLDSNAKTDGSATFTLDIDRPGMLIAVVAHPPRFGASVSSFDAAAALDVAGVEQVVQIPQGIAVIADNFWAAKKGRDALTVEWDESGVDRRGSDELFAEYDAALASPDGKVARSDGDVDAAFAAADKVIQREFRVPYLAHATMETMDCVIEYRGDAAEIWTGSQLQTVDQQIAAGILEVDPSSVQIHTQFAGGSFGRRAVPNSDYVAEAASIAKAIDGRAPIKLQWTREDDMRAGYYRPMSSHILEGALDTDGNITAWRHRIAIQSILAGTPFAGMIQNGIDASSVEGASNLPYAIPNVHVRLNDMDTSVPVLWWRAVGNTQNGYVTEAFFDELARESGRDPLEYRLALLKDHPRHTAVLNLAASKAGWGENLGEGRGRGIAVLESFGSVVAEIVDVSVDQEGNFSVDKVTCAVDCGIAVTPDVVKAQMEGGIGYGLSAALREEITITDGGVDQANFDRYRPLRINEMPDIDVHILPSANPPSGVGEPGTPPFAAALAAALADATGKRVYRMPIGDQLQA